MEKVGYLGYRKDRIDEVLSLYLNGATVWEIASYFETGDKDINEILDFYTKYL